MRAQFLLVVTLAFALTACGGPGSSSKNFSRTPSSGCTGAGCEEVTPARKQKVEAVISQRQVLPNFQKCLGLQNNQVSANTKTAYRESISSLSLDGMAEDVSAPMFMGITKVVSELCMDVINVEKNSVNRRFFQGFTLGGSTANSQTFNMPSTLSTLANACWGRNITNEEVNIVLTQLGSGKDLPAALFACTALLSSTAAIRY